MFCFICKSITFFLTKMSEYDVNITNVSNKTEIRGLCRLCLRNRIEKRSLNSPLLEILEVNVTSLFDLMQKLSPTKVSTHLF